MLQRVIDNRKSGYVFLNPITGRHYRSIHKTFDRAVRKVGITVDGTKLRFHDLRHIFATWLHNAGISLDQIRPLMAHRDRSTTDRYANLDIKVAGEALKVMPRIRPSTKEKISLEKSDRDTKWQEWARCRKKSIG